MRTDYTVECAGRSEVLPASTSARTARQAAQGIANYRGAAAVLKLGSQILFTAIPTKDS